MFVPLSLFAFCRSFTLSLYLSRFCIIVRRLLPLFVLFCLLDVRCARSISIGHSKPSFSWNTCSNFSSQSSHVSPGVSRIPSTLRLFLLDLSSRSICFCRDSPDQSDSHISLQFVVRYPLVYLQHCPLFLPVGSLWILCFFSNLIPLFLTSSICCLVIEKFPLIRFDVFFLLSELFFEYLPY